jgi:hypothetical protein
MHINFPNQSRKETIVENIDAQRVIAQRQQKLLKTTVDVFRIRSFIKALAAFMTTESLRNKTIRTIFGILAGLTFFASNKLEAKPHIDFNADGYADLAVGVPYEDVGKTADAGAVNIIYGSADGLTGINNKFFTQNTKGVPGIVQKGAQFGRALAAGDFNGDGYSDLAVGVPYCDQPDIPGGGDVVIFSGGPDGLSGSNSSFLSWFHWMRKRSLFGISIAAGNFDADEYADIAVGAPDAAGDTMTPGTGRGAVLVWYGSRFGMTRLQLWRQGFNGLREKSEYRDQFGSALAAGDFNGDGTSDLAVGAPKEEGVDYQSFGAVSVIYGRKDQGLIADGNQVWTQITDGGNNKAQDGDLYGNVLGSGDFNGDLCDELLVGAPGDRTVHVIYGTPKRLSSKKTQEFYGWSACFASADLDNDGFEDFAMNYLNSFSGGVKIRYGSKTGLQTFTAYLNEYLLPGLNFSDQWQYGSAKTGYALAADDFEGRDVMDLAVGIPCYDIPYNHNVLQITDAGAVAVVRNNNSMSETPIIQWTPFLNHFEGNYPLTIHEIYGAAEPGDRFGEIFAK